MTFETETLKCPACNRGTMTAESDKGNTLYLACGDQKCGARIKAESVMVIRAERDAKAAPETRAMKALP